MCGGFIVIPSEYAKVKTIGGGDLVEMVEMYLQNKYTKTPSFRQQPQLDDN